MNVKHVSIMRLNDMAKKGGNGMALETLLNYKSMMGEPVIHTNTLNGAITPDTPIVIDDSNNTITFKIQNGPIKQVGKNGCQVDHVIYAAKCIIEGLNKNFPCRENAMVITKLDEALMWSNERKARRERDGVEGTNTETKGA